jgi:hypothetical protein
MLTLKEIVAKGVQKIRGLNFRRIPFKGIYLQGGSMDG